MNKLYIFLFAGILIGCSVSEKKESTISFELVQFKVESADGCTDSVACASFEVNYPTFSGVRPEVAESLNSMISQSIGYENPEMEDASFEEMGKQFVTDFEKFQAEFNESIGWYFIANAEPLVVSDTLISISVNSEFFTGGAHGGFTTYFVNINPSTGSKVTLHSVFKSGFEDALLRAGEASFRDVRVIPDSVSFLESGFEFREGKFQLNDNYGFREEGVVFFYNNYEIAPYSLGPTEILVPFEVMSDWLR